ncbi:MAG: hypothetical protein IIA45_07295, partial [Bacteroidetes bacterium]|nr:hypothetical protein [Bacteroidota bacterium]
MKYIISTFLFFSISSSISAQTFAPPGAKWQYDYIDDFACGYIQYKYTHDTLINGKMTQALLRTLYVYNYLVGG